MTIEEKLRMLLVEVEERRDNAEDQERKSKGGSGSLSKDGFLGKQVAYNFVSYRLREILEH